MSKLMIGLAIVVALVSGFFIGAIVFNVDAGPEKFDCDYQQVVGDKVYSITARDYDGVHVSKNGFLIPFVLDADGLPEYVVDESMVFWRCVGSQGSLIELQGVVE